MKISKFILVIIFAFYSLTFADVKTELIENIKSNFQKRGLKDVKLNVTVLKKLDKPNGYYFLKVNIMDKKNNREATQYIISDGKLLIPDIVELKTGKSLIKELTFNYDTVNIPIKNLTLIQGNKNAKHIIIKISDFECPFCRKAYEFLEPKIKDRKDIAFYMLHYPLPIHKKAVIFAKVFEAGITMGYNFTSELYSGKYDKKSENEIIDEFAKKTNDPAKFKQLVNSKEIIDKIEYHKKLAEKYGFRATPVLIFDGKKVEGFDPKMIEKGLKSFKN
ncbi:thioredoxin domain-containing protein [Deferribacter thermophilus]|uniref:DsbA family protein n=1 Tax=Deferribacter thermophilus TaxID=53573 RepID=UPI003C20703E